MNFSKIKTILVATNYKTDGDLLKFSLLALWVIVTVLLTLTGHAMLEPRADIVGTEYFFAIIILTAINGILFGIILGIVLIALDGLIDLIKWSSNIFSTLKDVTQEELEIEPIPDTSKSRITFGK